MTATDAARARLRERLARIILPSGWDSALADSLQWEVREHAYARARAILALLATDPDAVAITKAGIVKAADCVPCDLDGAPRCACQVQAAAGLAALAGAGTGEG